MQTLEIHVSLLVKYEKAMHYLDWEVSEKNLLHIYFKDKEYFLIGGEAWNTN